jgi:hypothetical protein
MVKCGVLFEVESDFLCIIKTSITFKVLSSLLYISTGTFNTIHYVCAIFKFYAYTCKTDKLNIKGPEEEHV